MSTKTLAAAARQALAELDRLHDVIEPCENPQCPARKAIKDLKRAIDEIESKSRKTRITVK